MPPVILDLIRRTFDPGPSSSEFRSQWKNPGDVFSVLLILGGDVVARALAQLVGWVAYAVSAVVVAVGENKIMPLPDTSCEVINAKSGYKRGRVYIANIVFNTGAILSDAFQDRIAKQPGLVAYGAEMGRIFLVGTTFPDILSQEGFFSISLSRPAIG
ncbi:hypothetical protein VCV18_008985 [Metarhizium anisopliae]